VVILDAIIDPDQCRYLQLFHILCH